MAVRALATPIVWSRKSDQVVVSHSPASFLEDNAGSFAYFSAFEIRYSGVVGVDIILLIYPDYIKFKLEFQKFSLSYNKFFFTQDSTFPHLGQLN